MYLVSLLLELGFIFVSQTTQNRRINKQWDTFSPNFGYRQPWTTDMRNRGYKQSMGMKNRMDRNKFSNSKHGNAEYEVIVEGGHGDIMYRVSYDDDRNSYDDFNDNNDNDYKKFIVNNADSGNQYVININILPEVKATPSYFRNKQKQVPIDPPQIGKKIYSGPSIKMQPSLDNPEINHGLKTLIGDYKIDTESADIRRFGQNKSKVQRRKKETFDNNLYLSEVQEKPSYSAKEAHRVFKNTQQTQNEVHSSKPDNRNQFNHNNSHVKYGTKTPIYTDNHVRNIMNDRITSREDKNKGRTPYTKKEIDKTRKFDNLLELQEKPDDIEKEAQQVVTKDPQKQGYFIPEPEIINKIPENYSLIGREKKKTGNKEKNVSKDFKRLHDIQGLVTHSPTGSKKEIIRIPQLQNKVQVKVPNKSKPLHYDPGRNRGLKASSSYAKKNDLSNDSEELTEREEKNKTKVGYFSPEYIRNLDTHKIRNTTKIEDGEKNKYDMVNFSPKYVNNLENMKRQTHLNNSGVHNETKNKPEISPAKLLVFEQQLVPLTDGGKQQKTSGHDKYIYYLNRKQRNKMSKEANTDVLNIFHENKLDRQEYKGHVVLLNKV